MSKKKKPHWPEDYRAVSRRLYPPEKAKKRKRTKPRDTASYLASAIKLSNLVPSLKKFRRRKTLTKANRATIRRREKQLKNIPFLQPVTKAQAKSLGRKKIFLPGIRAIQLRSVPDQSEPSGYKTAPTSPGSTFKITKKGDIEIFENGRQWIYWGLDRDTVRSRRAMREAGKAVFEKTFPIEKVSELTKRAFERYSIQEVHLWAHAGVVGDGFKNLADFVDWVNEKWNQGRYQSARIGRRGDIYTEPSDPEEWISGIAIMIENSEYTQRRREIDAQAKKTNRKVDRTGRSV